MFDIAPVDCGRGKTVHGTDIHTILVVDNNKVVLRLMSHLLEELGYEVRTAVDGLDALEVLRHYQPDVLFIDLIMPKINGEQLCRILRSMPKMKNAFLVIFSAIVAESRLDFKEFGADACIAKGPFKQVREHVKAILAQAGKHDHVGISQQVIGSQEICERQITKELLSAKKHYEVVLNCISDAFFELTPDGNIFYLNAAACKMMGKSEESLLASNFVDLFEGEQHGRINELLAEVHDELLIVGEEEALFCGERQVLLSLVTVPDEVSGFIVATIRDISLRKKAEKKLKEQQENLELLVAERTRELVEANEKLKRDIVERKKLFDQREALVLELQEALAKVKTLSGFLPICASCKKIRDDKGYWSQVESYIGKHTDAEFSHSICPECTKKIYPDFFKSTQKKSD